MDTICAAGWTTSNSRAIVPQSEDTNVLPKWLMISFFMPFGPREDWTILASCLVACAEHFCQIGPNGLEISWRRRASMA